MSISKINPIYETNQKASGDTLSYTEWNDISGAVNASHSKINEVIDAVNAGGSGSGGTSPVTVTVDPQDPDKKIINVTGVLFGELKNKGNKGTNVTLAGNNNVNIEPRAAIGTGEGSNNPTDANRKGGNISLKPGDDIELWAHKRGSKKKDEVSVKVMTEVPNASDPSKMDEIAAKLQLNTADIMVTSKDKATDSDTTNVIFNKESNTRGYLKVRAQAIDLRSETHGGIALQPRGQDGEHKENKIKFEHGGGDGYEFGTFNTEKTSIYTGEYRFKKDGIVKMASRVVLDNTPGHGGNDKYKDNNVDPTTRYSYQKQEDDFYDVIASGDPQCTWEDIINVASTLNGTKYTRTHITDGGNVEIETKNSTIVTKEFKAGHAATTSASLPAITLANADINTWYSDTVDGVSGATRIITEDAPKIQLESSNGVSLVSMNVCVWDDADVTAENFESHRTNGDFGTGLKKDTEPETKYVDGLIYGITNDDRSKSDINMTVFDANLRYVTCRQVGEASGVNIESDAKVKIAAPKLTLEGVTGFGSTMTFGEADEGLRYQYKATKKGKNKQCDVLQVEVFNNGTETVTFNEATHLASNSDKFTDENGDPVAANQHIPTFYKTGAVSVPAGETKVVAQCSIMDIIKLVDYFKNGAGQPNGPWAPQQ